MKITTPVYIEQLKMLGKHLKEVISILGPIRQDSDEGQMGMKAKAELKNVNKMIEEMSETTKNYAETAATLQNLSSTSSLRRGRGGSSASSSSSSVASVVSATSMTSAAAVSLVAGSSLTLNNRTALALSHLSSADDRVNRRSLYIL